MGFPSRSVGKHPPDRLQSMESQSDTSEQLTHTHTHMHGLSVFLPGEFHEQKKPGKLQSMESQRDIMERLTV